jgi:hypothetical protein
VALIRTLMIIIFWEMTPCGSYKNLDDYHLLGDDAVWLL